MYFYEIPGVGDICSFAMLDVNRHGHPFWHPAGSLGASANDGPEPQVKGDVETEVAVDEEYDDIRNAGESGDSRKGEEQGPWKTDRILVDPAHDRKPKLPSSTGAHMSTRFATPDPDGPGRTGSERVVSRDVEQQEDDEEMVHSASAIGGKTELSLMHFHLTNPSWQLPPDSRAYLWAVRSQALNELQQHQQQFNLTPGISSAAASPYGVGGVSLGASNCLFSSLYSNPQQHQPQHLALPRHLNSTPVNMTSSLNGLETCEPLRRNIAHLPGYGHPDPNGCGFAGAIAESIVASISTSLTRSRLSPNTSVYRSISADPVLRPPSGTAATTSVSTVTKDTEPRLDPVNREEGWAPLAGDVSLPSQTIRPILTASMTASSNWQFQQQQMMLTAVAASAYQPYVSQTEEPSMSIWNSLELGTLAASLGKMNCIFISSLLFSLFGKALIYSNFSNNISIVMYTLHSYLCQSPILGLLIVLKNAVFILH
ncbi:unnamed protein product [Protopolystoma xenopodis]|uniref:Autophagy-related protein 9 n=1 Tax=Protopolystoma xenopodis TaxID=117903 RepID=A0A448WVP9_9PLAT|nr:unnamed protein product [Protopolystoma xenopodis]